jgi:hypothetical protein
MDEAEEEEIHHAVNVAVTELATHLGGTSDTGGPVENATQIKGRGDLGILLTDVEDRVLGRVWLAFGGRAEKPNGPALQGGHVQVQAEVCSEVVDPPVPIAQWSEGR